MKYTPDKKSIRKHEVPQWFHDAKLGIFIHWGLYSVPAYASIGLKYPNCGVACADYLEDFFIDYVSADSTAAVITEPIQGEGGFITPPSEYFKKIHKISIHRA